MPRSPLNRTAVIAIAVLAAFLVIGGVVAIAFRPSVLTRIVTINARDEGGHLIEPLNVWRSYTDRGRGVVGVTHDGDKVGFVRQEGEGVLIQLSDGTQGWVGKGFIADL